MRTSTTSGSRVALAAITAALVLTLRASLAGAAPDPAAWGESSGYNAIESNRVASTSLVIAAAPQSGDAARVETARQALAAGEIGGVQEEALTALVVDAEAAASTVAPADERVTQSGRIR